MKSNVKIKFLFIFHSNNHDIANTNCQFSLQHSRPHHPNRTFQSYKPLLSQTVRHKKEPISPHFRNLSHYHHHPPHNPLTHQTILSISYTSLSISIETLSRIARVHTHTMHARAAYITKAHIATHGVYTERPIIARTRK